MSIFVSSFPDVEGDPSKVSKCGFKQTERKTESLSKKKMLKHLSELNHGALGADFAVRSDLAPPPEKTICEPEK